MPLILGGSMKVILAFIILSIAYWVASWFCKELKTDKTVSEIYENYKRKEEEKSMNMNLDNENDYRELSTYVKDYFFVEFVAIPPDFDIGSFLTLREHVGIFENDKVQLSLIQKIVEGIKYSPVTSLLNNALLSPITGLFLLSVLEDLGLIVKTIPNPIRKGKESYGDFLKRHYNRYKKNDSTFVRGQDVKRVNLVIINLFQLFDQNIVDSTIKIAQKIQEQQIELEERRKKIGKLD